MLVNVTCHSIGQQVAYGAVFRYAVADVGRGNFKLWDGQFRYSPAGQLRQYTCCAQPGVIMPLYFRRREVQVLFGAKAGATAYHDMRQLEQLLPFAPALQLQKCIAAHQQAQGLDGAQLGAQLAQGVHGITGSGAMDFAQVEREGGLLGYRELHHRAAVQRTGLRGAAMGRLTGGYEADLAQPCQLQHFFGEAQMTEMEGVKGATEYAYGWGADR